jgi:hypothetical protein
MAHLELYRGFRSQPEQLEHAGANLLRYQLAGLLTGCKPGELVMIRMADVDRDAKTLMLPSTTGFS